MSRNAIIGKCIWLLSEIRELEKKGGLLDRFSEGPSGVFSAWPSGMPKNGYSREWALLHRSDVNGAIDRLDSLYAELNRLINILNEKDAA